MENNQVNCHTQDKCPACHTTGINLYNDLQDDLFGAPGKYKMSKCSNPHCNSIWLNPSPDSASLHLLYDSYSTHRKPTVTQNKERSLKVLLKKAVLNHELKYKTNGNNSINKLMNIISYIHPSWRDALLANAFYIPYIENGKLLDLGCGNGSSMLVMQNLGWTVEGVDFDEKAVSCAIEAGLNASIGDLFDKKYADNSFDAVMMNHVIEHLPNPDSYLKECLRILKPGGFLTALTPNADSLGHKLYKSSWRGLEIPRHLQIFTPRSLSLLANRVGFTKAEGFSSTQGIIQILDESKIRHQTGKFDVYFSSASAPYYRTRIILAGFRHKIFPNLSEVAVLRCQK